MTPYTPGDTWQEHYRGYELRINADRDVWWQVYNGTDRLHVDPNPTELVDQFLELKPLGGRVRVTEGGSVITRREDESTDGSRADRSLDEYTSVYVGEFAIDGDLVPQQRTEFSVPIRPTGLSPGDLWPSVYDGARYSFSTDGRSWWHNPSTKKRHAIAGGLPESLTTRLVRQKPAGGSFRVTPWGDVVTLVESPATETIKEQFGDLPLVIRNIIKLRRDRANLQMLPVYVGEIDTLPLDVETPSSLTDELTEEEQRSLEGWAAGLGATSATRASTHKATRSAASATDEEGRGVTETSDSTESGTDSDARSNEDTDGDERDEDPPIDDPVAWLEEDMEQTEARINDR